MNFFNKITITDEMNEYENDYMDACEEYIFKYINQIESFINNYGYTKEICSIEESSNIDEIEIILRKFLVENANGWNHLEIFGTLKDYPNKKVYVCCYEPYGEEVFCIEEKNHKLFFFDISNYKHGIKSKHINYLDRFKFEDCLF